MSDHHDFMRRCLVLAARGQTLVSPNPMVGAVVVYQGEIVAEGWHKAFGAPHAEPHALSVLPTEIPRKDCTLYVNLEPCAHFGKTPPCAQLLVDQGIGKVVVGSSDPNPLVNGKGIELLTTAGIQVETGVLEEECDELNRRFMAFHKRKRPYVILKWAVSADGFMAPESLERVQISSPEARLRLHQWRAQEDAVLVGATTASTDNPLLDTRLAPDKNPVRIILDPKLRAPKLNGDAPTLVFNCSKEGVEENYTYIKLPLGFQLSSVMQSLYERKVLSVLVEGGPTTLQHFMDAGLVDEIRIIRSKTMKIGNGLKAPVCDLKLQSQEDLGTDTIEIYRGGIA
jgi:diaminohydroxyphosphoribosylaminopyrimidine deaminase/5-amino-6-(5-phosphoribosylamino)uracil reductase